MLASRKICSTGKKKKPRDFKTLSRKGSAVEENVQVIYSLKMVPEYLIQYFYSYLHHFFPFESNLFSYLFHYFYYFFLSLPSLWLSRSPHCKRICRRSRAGMLPVLRGSCPLKAARISSGIFSTWLCLCITSRKSGKLIFPPEKKLCTGGILTDQDRF